MSRKRTGIYKGLEMSSWPETALKVENVRKDRYVKAKRVVRDVVPCHNYE